MRRWRMAVTVVMASMGIAVPSFANPGDHFIGPWGGGGGDGFTDNGGSGFLAGLLMRSGARVDNVEWIDQAGNNGPSHGGGGGTGGHYSSCPSGWLVYGLYGRFGSEVDNLGAICVNPADQTEKSAQQWGGGGGGEFSGRCTNTMDTRERAVGLHGRSGARVDSIGLICNVTPRT